MHSAFVASNGFLRLHYWPEVSWTSPWCQQSLPGGVFTRWVDPGVSDRAPHDQGHQEEKVQTRSTPGAAAGWFGCSKRRLGRTSPYHGRVGWWSRRPWWRRFSPRGPSWLSTHPFWWSYPRCCEEMSSSYQFRSLSHSCWRGQIQVWQEVDEELSWYRCRYDNGRCSNLLAVFEVHWWWSLIGPTMKNAYQCFSSWSVQLFITFTKMISKVGIVGYRIVGFFRKTHMAQKCEKVTFWAKYVPCVCRLGGSCISRVLWSISGNGWWMK